ncbi:ATP-binding protein [Streptomyces angustmyceticus]|uniref:ATP-binding protein n=1 Tax=Streptomyces angustmyceticus TaxID=285578 RepID=UPI003D8D3EA3
MLETPATPTWRITLPRSSTAVPIARAMVRTAMQDLRATADRTTAQLLTAELVTNALRHTRDTDPIELVVELRPAGCRIEVHDGDSYLVRGLGSPSSSEGDTGEGHGSGNGAADGRGAEGGAAGGRSTGDGHLPAQRGEDGGQAGDGDGEEAAGREDACDGDGDAATKADTDADADDTPGTSRTDTTTPSRRGLLLVRSLSRASGCRPTPRGKAVWFTLPERQRSRRR